MAPVAFCGFCIFGVAFLIRFLIAMHQELARMRRRTAVVQADCGGWDISIGHPIPGIGRAVRRINIPAPNKKSLGCLNVIAVAMTCATLLITAHAQTTEPPPTTVTDPPSSPASVWQYGTFLDAGYLLDFNHPGNQLFRSRGTTYKLDEPLIDMAGAYIRKTPSEQSRWGLEATVQAGQDTRVFGFSATAPNLAGYRGLRHLGPTDVSYLLPVGKGLTIQGGIFSSLIGIDSLYAKDNYSYTRPWGADFTPYLMLGVNGSYPLTKKVTLTGFVVNGYWHLANANSVPSWGGQLAYQATEHWSMKQTFLVGPHQSQTGLKDWRFLSDTILQWKRAALSAGFEFQGATEKVATSGSPRAAWVSSQSPVHYAIDKHWSVTVRPEVAWDSDGRWTGYAQTVKAVTSTVEYRVPYKEAAAIFRLEHRFDNSRGPAGGFFRGGEIAPGVVPLTPSQHLLVFGVILTFDGAMRR